LAAMELSGTVRDLLIRLGVGLVQLGCLYSSQSRLDRVATRLFLQSFELGPPHPQASVSLPPPPLVLESGAHSLREYRGGGGVPIRTMGQTL
jgi:hypothetical protein